MTDGAIFKPKPTGALRLEVGVMSDIAFSAVIRKVGQYPPFQTYALGLMVDVLMGQLIHGANLMAIRDGQLVAYAGWLRVDHMKAEAWRRGESQIPAPNWTKGDAAITTITVADNPADLPALLRGVSHVCAGLPVYRMRAFNDGRPDRKRQPIVGRKQDSLGGS
ncbi:hypothetical protein BH10PSE3_BH10PSE3_01980 [soil metagenome]